MGSWLGLLATACAVALVALVATAQFSYALTSFGRVAALSSNAANDEAESAAGWSLVGDGNGNWVAVWGSADPLDGTLGQDADILVVTSGDNGETWSAASALNPDAATDNTSADNGDRWPSIATDRSGTWIVAWARELFGGVAVARSFDNGATWTDPVPVATSGDADAGAIACDGADTWVIVFESSDDLGGTIGDDLDILFVRSTDDGATWSAPAPVNSDAATDVSHDVFSELATDGAGTWIAAWGGAGVEASTSTDNGATWGPAVVVPPRALMVGLSRFEVGVPRGVPGQGRYCWNGTRGVERWDRSRGCSVAC